MLAMGVVLLTPSLQSRLAGAIDAHQPVGRICTPSRSEGRGLLGEAAAGALTGLIWSPCAGPTLGAAIGLVVQARTFQLGAAEMLIFSLGAATPMLILAYGARTRDRARRRGLLMKLAAPLKAVGGGRVRLDRAAHDVRASTGALEAILVKASPGWLTDFSTRL